MIPIFVFRGDILEHMQICLAELEFYIIKDTLQSHA